MPIQMKSNTELRAQSREALKPVLAVSLLVVLFANLPQLITQLLMAPQVTALLRALLRYMDGESTQLGLMAELEAIFTQPRAVAAYWAAGVSALVMPVLGLGLRWHGLRVMRGEEVSPADVLHFLPLTGRALLLYIRYALRLMLYALPGAALMAAAQLGILGSLGSWVMLAGVYMAMLNWMLSPLILADHPEWKSGECLRASQKLMSIPGRKGRLLWMTLFFLLLELGASLIISMLAEVLPPVAGEIISMGVSLVLALYQSVSVCALYLAMQEETPWLHMGGQEAAGTQAARDEAETGLPDQAAETAAPEAQKADEPQETELSDQAADAAAPEAHDAEEPQETKDESLS